jgi:hypothetical protein
VSAPVQPEARVSPKDIFVGRRELLEALIPQIDPNSLRVVDAYGVRGIGKSRFLEHLSREGRDSVTDGIFLHNSATDLGGTPTATGTPTREPHIAMALRRFFGFLEKTRDNVVAQGDRRVSRHFERFSVAVTAARSELNQISIRVENELKAEKIEAGAHVQDTHISITGEMFEEEAADRRVWITGLFAEALNAISIKRALLWAIDDFDCIAGRPIGDWLVDLLGELEGGLVVLSRVPTAVEPTPAKEVLHEQLGPLSEREVQEFLDRCLPEVTVPLEVATVVSRFTDGHAGTLGLVAELLQRAPELAQDADELDARLRALPPDLEERQIQLVEDIVPDSELAAVEACAVARRFDAELLGVLLEEDLAFAEAKIKLLRRHTFITGEPDPDTGTNVYRVHGVIGRGIEERLRVGSPKRHAELHRRAADFHFRWLADFDEAEAQSSTAYGGWYRYEDRRWQGHTREWLYHQAHADRDLPALVERQRRVARTRFARVFLDAFWWWGCYVDFPFCRSLIEDWEATQQDSEWIVDMRKILDFYPTGWRKSEAEDWRWDEVRRALHNIRRACGLDGKLGALHSEDLRHTRALIELFLADAARYRAITDETERAMRYARTVAHYDDALQLFRVDSDFWNCAWTLFERAELHSQQGSEDSAIADWNAAVYTVIEHQLDDEELVANLHRLMADIEWRRGDAAASLAALGRAITHAYLFQNRPRRPDSYTAAFYREMLERTAAFLGEVWWRADRAEVLEPLLTAPLLAGRRDGQALAEAPAAPGPASILDLLPRIPNGNELEVESSPFLDEWTDICDVVAAAADVDLAAR